MKIYIGIDNGVSGSIGAVDENGNFLFFEKTPTKSTVSYTKTKVRMRTRVDFPKLVQKLISIKSQREVELLLQRSKGDLAYKVLIERPMINGFRFQASMSASASLEAKLIALEELGVPYEFCDSKGWQKQLLPSGIKGAELLKKASLQKGNELFPQTKGVHEDCDGILIALWAQRNKL